MATVYNFEKVAALADIVALNVFDPQYLVEIDRSLSANGLQSIVTYSYATGDPAMPVRITATINRNPKANSGFGETRISIRAAVMETCTVDGVVTWTHPAEAVIAFNLPGLGVYSVSELADLASAIYGLTFPSTDGSNVASTATLARWQHGIAALK